MVLVWRVLEGAKDAGDAMVIAACRRLIVADRLGWRRHADMRDWRIVKALAEAA
jgi:hypothetical protein